MALDNRSAPTTPAPTPHVVSLLEADASITLVGGKAAPLSRAHRAGHRVPAGFVLTTEALAHGVDHALSRAIDTELEALGDGRYAVRSSAVGEDGLARSFAGQLATFLDVPRDGVHAAVAACVRSASSLHVLRYGGGGHGAIAVIVQRMVPATAAGVAFSADPRTGERGVVLVEAVRGLGEALVSGRATPQSWRLDRDTCARRPTREGEDEVLTEAQARRVATLARSLEQLFGVPQDVEWAFVDDELHLLQARPVTALPAEPIPLAMDVPEGSWTRDDHHGVLSPLGWAWFQPYPKAMAEGMQSLGLPLESIEAARIGGHLYLRFVMKGGGGKAPPRWILWLASRIVPALRRANKNLTRYLDREEWNADIATWEKEWRPELREKVRELFLEDPSSLTDGELLERIRGALALTERGLQLHARLGAANLFGVGKLVLFAEDRLGWDADRAQALVIGSSTATTALYRQLEELVRAHRSKLSKLASFPKTWAELAIECPALSASLAAWLGENRLRMMHYDPKHPTLGERPEYVFSIVEALATAPDDVPVPDATRELDAIALDEAEKRLGALGREELARLLVTARRGYALRDENGIDPVSRPAGLLRYFVLELGRRIEDLLGARAHAVYLYPEEHAPALRGSIDVAALVKQRRGEESWALRNRGPKHHGPREPPPPPADAFPDGLARTMRIFSWMERGDSHEDPPETGGLRGLGIGSRIVTAPARCVDRPEELAGLRHGEVVVCRITSPEWSLALARVAALVTDEGGGLSHPAIIAREFGLTAVLGVGHAMKTLRTGDLIRVDPIAGTVARR